MLRAACSDFQGVMVWAWSCKVVFDGSLPDLFREGQGIVAEGIFKNSNFFASEVLAKHDENYMPPEVADALKKNNVWKGDSN